MSIENAARMNGMTERELTANDAKKLDQLHAILATFAEINKTMDLPEMRVLMTVCRHEGEGLPRDCLTPKGVAFRDRLLDVLVGAA